MRAGLVGHTGFIGGNLLRAFAFTDLYNSRTVDAMRGQVFDLLVVAGAPAAKWIANSDPETDMAGIQALIQNLCQTRADRLVLVSTVDVYPFPTGVDEMSAIDRSLLQPYGRHRLLLEDAVRDHFGTVLIVRLPGLFGPDLRKNVIYDLLHDHEVEKIDPYATFQFYDVRRLWADMTRFHDAGLTLVNVATEPVSVDYLAEHVFGLRLPDAGLEQHARYDFRTRYDELLGGARGYLYSVGSVLADLSEFVGSFKAAAP